MSAMGRLLKSEELNWTAALSRFADQQPIGTVKKVISGSFKIIPIDSFHRNTQFRAK